MTPSTITARVLSLKDRGYSAVEIALQMKADGVSMTRKRVDGILRRAGQPSEDSRRIFEIHELMIEAVAILRVIVGDKGMEKVRQKMRSIESRDLPQMLGDAIEKTFTESS